MHKDCIAKKLPKFYKWDITVTALQCIGRTNMFAVSDVNYRLALPVLSLFVLLITSVDNL
jgi:hypothetical protein